MTSQNNPPVSWPRITRKAADAKGLHLGQVDGKWTVWSDEADSKRGVVTDVSWQEAEQAIADYALEAEAEDADGVIEGVIVGRAQGDAPVNQATEGLVLEIMQAMLDVVDGHLKIAEGMAQLVAEHDWSQRKIAAEIGCSQSTVSRHLDWLGMSEPRPLYGDRIKAIKAAPAPAPVIDEPKVEGIFEVIEGVIVGEVEEFLAEVAAPVEPKVDEEPVDAVAFGVALDIFNQLCGVEEPEEILDGVIEPVLVEPVVVELAVVEPVVVEDAGDWTLEHSPAERFASHLATAVQAIEAAYAETRANPQKFTHEPMRVLDAVDLIKTRARSIEARATSLQ
jgi:hypothetical protein